MTSEKRRKPLRPGATRSLAVKMALVGAAGLTAPAAAQVNEFGIGAGIAVPVSEVNTRQGPGLHLLGYAGYRLNPTLQVRGELAFVRFDGKPAPSTGGTGGESYADLRVVSIGGTLVYTPRGTGTGVYGFLGAGAYALAAGDEANSDGLVPGASLGVGTNLNVGGAGLFAQGRLEVPFSSFSSGTESAFHAYLPFTVGLRIPCCGGRPPGA